MSNEQKYQEILVNDAKKVEAYLQAQVDRMYKSAPRQIVEAMEYSLMAGGKRIRPVMMLEAAKACGLDDESKISTFACALEMIHSSSLIHDDLPCMDDDDLRRGKPSCHKQFDEAVALLAGDTLLTIAFEVAASNPAVSPKSAQLAVKTLAREAGALGMAGGQTLDLANTVAGYKALRKIHMMKTSALIKAACTLGYYAACDKPVQSDLDNIRLYAEAIGLAFQIHDDLLDVKSDTATLGKRVGSDAKNQKKTVLAFLSMAEAEEEEALLTLLAVEAVSEYRNSDTLCKLAIWLLSRKK